MTDQELKKIAEDLHYALDESPYNLQTRKGIALEFLTKVHDAQKNKLRIATMILNEIAGGCCDSAMAYRKAIEALEKMGVE